MSARSTGCAMALVILTMLALSVPTDAMRVLWMGEDKTDARTGGKAAQESTDRLLQEAIRNIDQLTSVARSLSKEWSVQPPQPHYDLHAPAAHDDAAPPNVPTHVSLSTQGSSSRCIFKLAVKNSKTQLGDKVLVVGNLPALGSWQLPNALLLKTSSQEFPMWSVDVKLEPGAMLKFKFVMQGSDGRVTWEGGDNRNVLVPASASAGVMAEFDKLGQEAVPGSVSADFTPPADISHPLSLAYSAKSSPAQLDSGIAKLHLRVKCKTNPGDILRVCGWLPQMGGWKADRAAQMTTRSGEYPCWSISLDIPMEDLKESIKYKYVIVSNSGEAKHWEDSIADRCLDPERRAGGVLAGGMHTHVDDGDFNCLNRACTYVRDAHERTARKGTATEIVPAQQSLTPPTGMQLVSMDQVRQWEVRVVELEEECMSLKERAILAESTVDALKVDLEEERRQNEEIMAQMKFVEDLLARMKKIETQVTTLEQTKHVLLTRSESLSDMSAARQSKALTHDLADDIEQGLSQAALILNGLDKRLPASPAPKNGGSVRVDQLLERGCRGGGDGGCGGGGGGGGIKKMVSDMAILPLVPRPCVQDFCAMTSVTRQCLG
jgi:hypothetical protein